MARGRPILNLAKLLDGCILLLVLGTSVAIGGVHAVSVAAAALVSLAFAGLAVVARYDRSRRRSLPLAFWCLAGVGLWSLLQYLPLGQLGSAIDPQMADIWTAAGLETPRLTANLAGTTLNAVKALGGAILLAGAFVYFHRVERVDRLVDVIIGSAALLLALGLVQAWLQSDAVVFIYQPRMGPIRDGLHGSFVNPDHFGALMAISALLALGRGLGLGFERSRYVYHMLFILLLIGLVLSLSLTAATGFLVGLVAMALLWRRQSERLRLRDLLAVATAFGAVAVTVAGTLVFLGLAGNPREALEAQVQALDRQAIVLPAALRLALDHPLTGIGSGSLSDLLGPYLDGDTVSVWFVRSQPLQSLLDLGLPVGSLFLVVLALASRPVLRRWPADKARNMVPVAGALCGAAAIALVDFALEIPAIGVLCTLLFGALLSQHRRLGPAAPTPQRAPARVRLRAESVLAMTTALLLACVAWALVVDRRSASAEADFQDAATALGEVPDGETMARLGRRVLAIRPARGRVFAMVGESYLRNGQIEPAADWIERALARLPDDPVTLHLAGLLALQQGEVDLARQRFARAMASRPAQRRQIVSDVLALDDDPDLWARIFPDPETRRALGRLLLHRGEAIRALTWAANLLGHDGRDAVALEIAVAASLVLDLDALVEQFTETLIALDPDNLEANLALAELARRRGDYVAARDVLEAQLQAHPDATRLRFALAEVLVERAETGEPFEDFALRIGQLRRQLRPVAHGDPELQSRFHQLSARYFLTTGEWRGALSAARFGTDVTPDDPRLWELLGIAQLELGDLDAAEASLLQALALDPGRAAAQRALARLRARRERDALGPPDASADARPHDVSTDGSASGTGQPAPPLEDGEGSGESDRVEPAE